MFCLSPHPVGRDFSITFVDDTDSSTRENTEPVYELLARHGFWGTKTVWPLAARSNSAFRRDQERAEPSPNTGATLEEPDYLAFIRRLKTQGFEIALHNVAAGNSNRADIERGLAHFHATLGQSPELIAFHQTNIENLYCGADKLDAVPLRWLERLWHSSQYEGHREGSPSFWGDLVHETFRYVRLPFHTIDEINTLRVSPSMPFKDPRRPYVRRWFASSDGADVVRFNRLLSEANIEHLARQRGVCIIYTHFAKAFARRRNGAVTLDREFERTIERVTSHPAACFATASQVLRRLQLVNQIRLSHGDGVLQLENCGDEVAEEVVLRVAPDVSLTSETGAPLTLQQGSLILPTLPPGGRIAYRTNQSGHYDVAPRDGPINRRERKRIEYLNYLGLLRSARRDRQYYAAAR